MTRSSSPGLLVPCLALLFVAPRAAQQGVKLSAPPGTAVVGDVDSARFSPDGAWIVYQADQEVDQVFGLYSVSVKSPRAPVRLDEDLVYRWWIAPDGRSVAFASEVALFSAPIDGSRPAVRLSSVREQVQRYRPEPQFTPDGKRVVYGARFDGSDGLFVAPLDGSAAPRRLDGEPPPAREIDTLRIDARGDRAVYTTTLADGSYQYELHSVPLAEDTGGPVRLNAPLPAGGDVSSFQLTPDGKGVVYVADQERLRQNELFLVPIDGSAPPRKLNAPLSPGISVHYDFAVSPDGTRALYRVDQATVGVRLFSVRLDGSQAPVVLNAPVAIGGWGSFRIAPTGKLVVYLADQIDGAQGREVFLAPVDGSAAPRRLSPPLGDQDRIYDFEIDPAGERALFIVVREIEPGTRVYDLFSASLLRPELVELGDGLHRVTLFQVSPDSRRVVALDRGGLAGELYSIAIDGKGEPIPLGGPSFHGVEDFSIAPRGGRVLFIADRETLGASELHCVPLDGRRDARKLNGPLATAPATQRSVYSFQFSPDGNQAAYFVNGCDPYDECDDEGPRADVLHVVATDASSSARQLYPPDVPGLVRMDDTGDFRLVPDGERIVVRAGEAGDDGYDQFIELYSLTLDGSLQPVRLNGPVQVENDVRQAELTLDGASVVFFAAGELWRAPVEGGVAPTRLAPDAGYFTLTSDGTQAVYAALDEQAAIYELYAVPLDGSAPPVELGEPLPAGWTFLDRAITPDGRRIVYRAGSYHQPPSEIHSALLDGGPSILLGGPLVAGGDFQAMQLGPDGSRVVYLADQEVDERFELYSVPPDGSASPVRLNGPLVAGGDVSAGNYDLPFAIAPGSRRVVYIADQDVDEQFELYSVPLDGSATPMRLTRSFPSTADVRAFQIDPAGMRVVYVADGLQDEVFELFDVPIDGSAAPVRLGSPFVQGGDVFAQYSQRWSFRITPDGRAVLYVADARADEVFELFGVALDSPSVSYRLSAPLVQNGDVWSFQPSPDSTRVLYLADQDVDGVLELYVSSLLRERVRRR